MDSYVGKRLDGRYEIHEVIGVGGMAVVYKAYDNIDRQTVAVKILKDEYLANAEFRRRFQNESKAIAVLSHPNIVKVLDVSFGEKLQYIVMEYVEGITLKDYIEQQGKVRIREALYFVMQILRALQHAHDKGIVHRDIKPQNIMLISNGTIKVADFGIATFSRGETRTMTESAIGSVHYISPEQAKGSITDAKSDIYSVGVVLYEMLTGCLPFQSENAVSVALMQLQQEPKRPREINPEIPVGLEQIIMKAMQKNSADRYQSAAEMLVDLSTFGKNPAVKFDYDYFVDKQPTKFIPSEEIKQKLREENEATAAELNEDDPDAAKKKKTVGILAGVLAGLLIFVIIMIAVFAGGSSKKLSVPNFIGMNYTDDIASNDEYADYWSHIETKFIIDSNYDDGEVINQDPKEGRKISNDDKIVLEIASNSSKIPVPDVYGFSPATAQSTLRSEGFLTTIDYDSETDAEIGTVARTSPERGEGAVPGSTIVIYIASDTAVGGEMVMVPVLAGETLSSAKTILEKSGLVLDIAGSETRDSDKPKNQIIGNELAGQEVPKGTKIAVYISSGIQSHVSISFKLPDVDVDDAKIEVKVNGTVDETTTLNLDGSDHTFSVGGTGSGKKVEVFANGQKIYSATVNFASQSDPVSNEKMYNYKVEKPTDVNTTDESTTKKPTASSENTSSGGTTEKEKTTESTGDIVAGTTEPTSERETINHGSDD